MTPVTNPLSQYLFCFCIIYRFKFTTYTYPPWAISTKTKKITTGTTESKNHTQNLSQICFIRKITRPMNIAKIGHIIISNNSTNGLYTNIDIMPENPNAESNPVEKYFTKSFMKI